jgi:putative acetyltransferase
MRAEDYRIIPAVTDEQLAAFRVLLEEYARMLELTPAAESMARDLADFPGPYAPPGGALLLALAGDRAVGGVALRPLEPDVCEMKRLYVQPGHRSTGLGRELALRIIEHARQAGYRLMRLDTLPSMTAAASLYHALGFRDIEPYGPNPLPSAQHMELVL